MGRWEPDAAARLRAAAMELYVERGFEQTTVADIAARAGLTARTFFRYFTDKREVIFGGSSALQETMVAAVAGLPPEATALTAVGAALDAAADMIGGRRDYSRHRHAVIFANSELQERELSKMATLSTALADALRTRGAAPLEANLAAETAIAVFRVGWQQWVTADDDLDLADVLRETLAQLQGLAQQSSR